MGEMPVFLVVRVVVRVVVAVHVTPVGVAVRHPHGTDLHLGVDHRSRHRHDQGADVLADVEQDRALTGEGVLGGAHTAAVPGSV